MKRMRQEAIAAILEETDISSQAQLVRELRSRGFEATQATVSRDLVEMNVARVRREGGFRYARLEVEEGRLREEELRRLVQAYLRKADSSGNLLVLRTGPGNAQPLALGLDRARLEELLGTVAGDDTVICVARNGASAARLAQRLRGLAAGRGRGAKRAAGKGSGKEKE
jgi:transcriptional regulator of arginine metabolism